VEGSAFDVLSVDQEWWAESGASSRGLIQGWLLTGLVINDWVEG
jgi:hypothetical protein